MKRLLSILFISLFSLLLARSAFADTICQPVYGGGQTCITTGNILVTKTVQNPQTNQFVQNLATNDPRFSGNQTVTFQITVTNTGGQTIQQTAVKDTFPGFVNFQPGGTTGSFDNNTKTLTFTVDLLGPNETRNFTVLGKVIDPKNLPDGITCVVNQVTATTNSGQMSQANTQLCIEKAVTRTKGGLPIVSPSPVPATPATGPEAALWLALLPGGVVGWTLRKKSLFVNSKTEGGEK